MFIVPKMLMIVQVLIFLLQSERRLVLTLQCFPLYRVPQVKMVVQVQQGPSETEGPQEPWEHQGPRASM